MEAHPLYKVLTSAPGIGVRTCARILTEATGKRFASAAHPASYAGIAPLPLTNLFVVENLRAGWAIRNSKAHCSFQLPLRCIILREGITTATLYEDPASKNLPSAADESDKATAQSTSRLTTRFIG